MLVIYCVLFSGQLLGSILGKKIFYVTAGQRELIYED